jgi:hypothetical protein
LAAAGLAAGFFAAALAGFTGFLDWEALVTELAYPK